MLSGREVLTDVRPRKDDVGPLKFFELALLLRFANAKRR